MDSELDRTHTTFDEHSAKEFEEWLDEMDRLSDPERIEAERRYWLRKSAEANYGTYVGDEECPF